MQLRCSRLLDQQPYVIPATVQVQSSATGIRHFFKRIPSLTFHTLDETEGMFKISQDRRTANKSPVEGTQSKQADEYSLIQTVATDQKRLHSKQWSTARILPSGALLNICPTEQRGVATWQVVLRMTRTRYESLNAPHRYVTSTGGRFSKSLRCLKGIAGTDFDGVSACCSSELNIDIL